jgi:ABC-type nitrate/sulfonate/bicarbonate transport system substrate-binding protein
MTPRLRRLTALLLALAALGLAGCAGGGGEDRERLTIALDWVPNTNHTGIYVARARGWFAQRGIDLRILPYAETSTDVLVAEGQADLGVSFVPSLLLSRAAGLPIKAVASVMTRNTEALAVLEDSRYRRPRDLAEHTVYGGFGLPYEVPLWSEVIRRDGGEPNFRTAVLNTAAYEALYAQRIDWSALFLGWEAIEARRRTPPVRLRLFPLKRYLGAAGDFPSVILVASEKAIAERPDVLRRGLAALGEGYSLAARRPDDAADLLIAADSGLKKNTGLVHASAAYLASSYLRRGVWGETRPQQVAGIGRILSEADALAGPDGEPVHPESFDDYWTNDLLPGSDPEG